MDRRIEPQPFNLFSFLDNLDWNIMRLCYNAFILLFLAFSICIVVLYGLCIWQVQRNFYPDKQTQVSHSKP
jgi:hypothetical protein